ncbi:MAG: DEAD/DEAH box helicase [Bdellovibrionaceae bacterium]|nr:DEAD/DEAH box helicase [Pseudobdellovibrionaceae bacterium]
MNTHTSSLPELKFAELNLDPHLLKAIEKTGYTKPTPIQAQSIPKVLEGRDILGAAQTGTGKTAAFALPILNHIIKKPVRLLPKRTRVLVVSPTRELAVQIYESFLTYGKFTQFKASVIFGGVGQESQVRSVAQGVDVLIATPGRLLDLIQQKHIFLDGLEIFVLDEADRMLDMGFLPDVRRIVQLLPAKRQSLFFSATMPKEIQGLADSLLSQPVHVKVTPVASTVDKIKQSVMFVDKARKKELLIELFRNSELNKVIVFTRTKHGANRLVETLLKNKIMSQAIHGNKSQNARQQALDNLRTGKNRVLVATDIVARGVDIDQISHVINYELPNDPESYVHRIGRTARAGHSGVAISLCDAEEKSYLKDIEKLIAMEIERNKEHKFHSDSVEHARVISKGKAKSAIESRDNQRRFKSRFKKPGSKQQSGSDGAKAFSKPVPQHKLPPFKAKQNDW